jgi:hypothetical protein
MPQWFGNITRLWEQSVMLTNLAGQQTSTGANVDTQSGATPAFAAGNANCGQFTYLNGALNS